MGGIVGRLLREFAVTLATHHYHFHGHFIDHHADHVRVSIDRRERAWQY